MNETLQYIDDYLGGKMHEGEKKAFEHRCETDPAFAEEVAFVIAVRQGVKEELYTRKKQEFNELYKELVQQQPEKTIGMYNKITPYLAAACLMVVIALIYLLGSPSPQKLAASYINENMQTMGATMGSADSLQWGIEAYNNKNYKEAEIIFSKLVQRSDVGDKALQYLGVTYLITERYDAALLQFKQLQTKQQFANPGLFYEALVYMKRNSEGDDARAKAALKTVIQQDLPGSEHARSWLDNF